MLLPLPLLHTMNKAVLGLSGALNSLSILIDLATMDLNTMIPISGT